MAKMERYQLDHAHGHCGHVSAVLTMVEGFTYLGLPGTVTCSGSHNHDQVDLTNETFV